MLTDAAHIIFDTARRRCYTLTSTSQKTPVVVDVDDEDAWDALNEVEGIQVEKKQGKARAGRPKWLPSSMDPVLEELPKWDLLTEVLQEIEQEIILLEASKKPAGPGSNTVLIMASSTRTCSLITEFLTTQDDRAPKGSKGLKMMMQKLREYLWWKGQAQRKDTGRSPPTANGASSSLKSNQAQAGELAISEALQKKDREKAERNKSRRRVRGGATQGTSSRPAPTAAGTNIAPTGDVDPLAEL